MRISILLYDDITISDDLAIEFLIRERYVSERFRRYARHKRFLPNKRFFRCCGTFRNQRSNVDKSFYDPRGIAHTIQVKLLEDRLLSRFVVQPSMTLPRCLSGLEKVTLSCGVLCPELAFRIFNDSICKTCSVRKRKLEIIFLPVTLRAKCVGGLA